MTKQSILHPKIEGLIVLSGLQGLGKSTLAFTAERPDLAAVLDYDLKGAAMARDYGIEQYYAPKLQVKDNPTEYDAYEMAMWSINTIQAIKPGTTSVIFDNATLLEEGLRLMVAKNPAKYGVRADNVTKGAYGGANPGVSVLWANITNFLQNRGVKVIFMINHMTQPWAGGAPVPNRFHVKGNKIFRQLSVLSLILTPGREDRGGQPPTPAALVIKEMMAVRKYVESKKEFVTIRAFPSRFPVATWPAITHYFEKPADFHKPAPGETWTPQETEAYGEFLSQEQIQWIKNAANIKFSEDGESEKVENKSTPPAKKEETHAPVDLSKLAPKQRFVQELINTGKFKNAGEVAAAMGERKYVEAKHEELKQLLLAEVENAKATQTLEEEMGPAS